MALATAKASVVHLLIAIKLPTRVLLQACYAIAGFVWTWTVASVLALAFQCDLPNPWNSEGNECVDQFHLNVVIHCFNILTDLLLVAVPCLMMQKVKIQPRKRWVASGLFASRLIVPVITVIMLLYMRTFYGPDPDFTWHALAPQVWAQIMLNASIVAACIPSLKPFLAAIKAGLTVVNIPERELTSSYVRHSKKETRPGKHDGGSSSEPSGIGGETRAEAVEKMECGYPRPWATKLESPVVVEHDCSESVKGLTEGVIMHGIDYSVEFESNGSSHDPDGDLTGRSESSLRPRQPCVLERGEPAYTLGAPVSVDYLQDV